MGDPPAPLQLGIPLPLGMGISIRPSGVCVGGGSSPQGWWKGRSAPPSCVPKCGHDRFMGLCTLWSNVLQGYLVMGGVVPGGGSPWPTHYVGALNQWGYESFRLTGAWNGRPPQH